MLDIYTVSFFGHRKIENALAVENRMEALIRQLLAEKEYTAFSATTGSTPRRT